MSSNNRCSEPFVVPALQKWYNGLNESQKEQYRTAFNATEGAASSETQQTSTDPYATSLFLSNGSKSSNLEQSNTKIAPQRYPIRETSASSFANKDVDSKEAPRSSNSLHDKPSHKSDNLPHILSKPSELPATLEVLHAVDNELSNSAPSPTAVHNNPYLKPTLPQAQINKVQTAGSTDTSVYSGRRFSSTGTKIPMSLKRGNLGAPENSLIKKPNLTSGPTSNASLDSKRVPEAFSLPNWCRELHITPRTPFSRETLTKLLQIRDHIDKCAVLGIKGDFLQERVNKIREELHQYEYIPVDEVLIKKSKLLEYGVGLPRLFSKSEGCIIYPYDIAADAEALYNKWRRHDFDPDILRGIDYRRKKGKNDKARMGSQLITNYPNRISANEFGDNDLVNGQWWPILLAALRDGAHGAPQAGIHGATGKGAYSILVSGSSGSSGTQYADKDEGDVLYYCGTEGGDGEMTDATKRLHENITFHRPVRVLRTSKLPADNPYKPSFGYRYDGLYDVLNYEVLDVTKAHHRFHLKRQDNQAPIRYKGVYARPSQKDIVVYNKVIGNERLNES